LHKLNRSRTIFQSTALGTLAVCCAQLDYTLIQIFKNKIRTDVLMIMELMFWEHWVVTLLWFCVQIYS